MAPNPRNRSILGPANPFDDGEKANYVDGGTNALDRPNNTNPAPAFSDQASTDTQAERAQLAQAYRDAQRTAELVTGSGAGGAVVAAAGEAVTYAPGSAVDYSGAGATVGDEGPIVTRSAGGDDGSGYGKAIG
jgi:hypothetical protein